MNKDVVIQAKGLGKSYHIYEKPSDRLKQLFFSSRGRFYNEFWALKNIDFTLCKGEAIGIIGRNGSGKSTLLQILCQTLTPTTGSLHINGRIAALLELGAGFNPEFTGKENIFLNGAILGFSQKEMCHRYDEIISFADIGDFINQPVKTYSSGMFVRLAFAVQACVNPDILIVDEALSVGDIFFQQKCAKRMHELREQGTSLIFVSHDMSIVRDLCDKCMYLQKGDLKFFGRSTEAIRQYFAETQNNEITSLSTSNIHAAPQTSNNFIEGFTKRAIWVNPNTTANQSKIIAADITDENNQSAMQVKMTKKIKFKVLYQVFTKEPIFVTIVIRNRYDHIIHSSGSYTSNSPIPSLHIGEYALFEMELACMIEAGNYTASIMLSLIGKELNRGITVDESPRLGPITVLWNYEEEKAPWYGMVGLPTRTQVEALGL